MQPKLVLNAAKAIHGQTRFDKRLTDLNGASEAAKTLLWQI